MAIAVEVVGSRRKSRLVEAESLRLHGKVADVPARPAVAPAVVMPRHHREAAVRQRRDLQATWSLEVATRISALPIRRSVGGEHLRLHGSVAGVPARPADALAGRSTTTKPPFDSAVICGRIERWRSR